MVLLGVERSVAANAPETSTSAIFGVNRTLRLDGVPGVGVETCGSEDCRAGRPDRNHDVLSRIARGWAAGEATNDTSLATSGEFICQSRLLKWKQPLPISLHADHDPTVAYSVVVKRLRKRAEMSVG